MGADGPADSAALAQGTNVFNIKYKWKHAHSNDQEIDNYHLLTWDQLFLAVAPALMTSTNEAEMTALIEAAINATRHFGEAQSVRVDPESIQTIIYQLRGLGLITKAANGAPRTWTITPYGERQVLRLKGVPKE
jgi:predicted MarR family transcription regulator